MFSYEFCEISKSTFFTEHVWASASRFWKSNFNIEFRIKGSVPCLLLFTFVHFCVTRITAVNLSSHVLDHPTLNVSTKVKNCAYGIYQRKLPSMCNNYYKISD